MRPICGSGSVWLVFTAGRVFLCLHRQGRFLILLSGLLLVAGIKAGMVGWYFMHLKFEGNWVYALIIPAVILATILVLASVPTWPSSPRMMKRKKRSVWVAPADRARLPSAFPVASHGGAVSLNRPRTDRRLSARTNPRGPSDARAIP